jgi:midasin (ATPase involved in ribosome maturation)
MKALYSKPQQSAPAPQPQSGGLGSHLEQALVKVLAEQSVDKVLEASKPLLEKHIVETFGILPQVHVVQTPKETVKIEGVVHEKFDTVLNLVNADIPVFLTGAAGTGKNVICKQISKAMNLEFYFSNAVTQEYKLTGFIDANGRFHETQFYQAFTKGGLFMLDEIDASIPEVLIILNAAIANRYFDFPTGRVEAHEDFRLIAAGNTFGTGADIEYTGRFQLDAASLDRFALVEIDYSPTIEKAIAQGDSELVDFIHAFRSAVKEAGMKHLATYRSIERISKLKEVMNLVDVLKMCLLKNLGVDDIRILNENMRSALSGNKYAVAMRKMVA